MFRINTKVRSGNTEYLVQTVQVNDVYITDTLAPHHKDAIESYDQTTALDVHYKAVQFVTAILQGGLHD